MSKIGIIGGSGLDDPDILERPSEVSIDTPYGDPSSNIKEGKISGQELILIMSAPHDLNIWLSDFVENLGPSMVTIVLLT